MTVTGVTTNAPTSTDYNKAFAELSAMTDMNLLGEYMDEMYPTNQPTPADGDDMTWDNDEPLTYAALVRTVYRLQDEVAALAGQVVELRERMEKWTADS